MHQEIIFSPDQNKLFKLLPGVSLAEESCGSNAVNLALRLRKWVYIEPKHHFCDIFNDWYCFAIPLITAEGVKGCLALSLVGRRPQKEMIGITKLLASNIMKELHYACSTSPIRAFLTEQQVYILELFAQGLTSAAVASEMLLSQNTIKYHRRQIFKALAVQSIAEAVAKAAKMGLFQNNKG